jgi:hypothetical protein
MAEGNESNWWPGGPEGDRGANGYPDPRAAAGRGSQPPWEQPAQRPRPPAPRPADQRPTDPRYADRRPAGQWNSAPDPQDQGQPAGSQGRDSGDWRWMVDGRRDFRPPELPGEAPYAGASGGRHRTGAPAADAGRPRPGNQRGYPDEPGLGDEPGFGDEPSFADEPRREARSGPGRMVTYVGGGLIVAVVLVAFALGFSRGGAVPGAVPTQDATVGAQGPTPGAPTVTARSAGGQQVEFSWTYAGTAAGDTYRVLENGSGQPATVDKPDIVLSAAQGQQVCVQVQVVSAASVASAESNKACWPS